jgi:hypothetical protein
MPGVGPSRGDSRLAPVVKDVDRGRRLASGAPGVVQEAANDDDAVVGQGHLGGWLGLGGGRGRVARAGRGAKGGEPPWQKVQGPEQPNNCSAREVPTWVGYQRYSESFTPGSVVHFRVFLSNTRTTSRPSRMKE